MSLGFALYAAVNLLMGMNPVWISGALTGTALALLAMLAYRFIYRIYRRRVNSIPQMRQSYAAIVGGGAAGAAAGWCLAGLYLAAKATSRSEEISQALPSVLELLSIVVSAGMMVEQGFRQVSEDDSFYPLSEEFARVDREINQLGYTRVEALKSLSQRCGNVQLDYFCAAMIEATKKGSSIADVLMAQAAFARKARRDALVEKARRLSSMMALPLSFFFIPAILIVVLAPQIGMLVQLFSSMQISF